MNRNKRRSKEVEIDIDRDDINKADLKQGHKGRKGKGKFRGKQREEAESKDYSSKGENDVSWYSHYPEFLSNVAGVNYGYPVGSQIDYGTLGAFPEAYIASPTAPGVLTVDFVPTFGSAEGTVESPINKVAIQMFAAERQKLGSRADYEANDNVMYLGAMDSAYLVYGLGMKIYGCLRMASPFNYYFLEPLFKSMRVDYASFAANAADFRYCVNEFAIFLNSRLIPASFDLFKRHMWMISNIFTDSETPKAQMYQYMLSGYYRYTEVTEGPSKLAYKDIPRTGTGSLFTFDDYRNLVNDITVSILNSTDIDQMSADIGKAFENDVYNISLIPEEYQTPITFSKEVLSQFENATLMGNVISGDIVQEVNLPTIVSPRVSQNMKTLVGYMDASIVNAVKYSYLCNRLINQHMAAPTEKETIVATRGMCNVKQFEHNTSDGKLVALLGGRGTEVYTTAYMTYITKNRTIENVTYVNTMTGTASTSGAGHIMKVLGLWSAFDWAPQLRCVEPTSKFVWQYLDLDMYATIDTHQLDMLHTCALFSEFYSDKFINAKIQ